MDRRTFLGSSSTEVQKSQSFGDQQPRNRRTIAGNARYQIQRPMTKVEKTSSNFSLAYPHFPQGAIQWTCILWVVFQFFVGFIRLTSKLKNDCITHSKGISNKQLSQKISPNQLSPLELQRKVKTCILWVVYTFRRHVDRYF